MAKSKPDVVNINGIKNLKISHSINHKKTGGQSNLTDRPHHAQIGSAVFATFTTDRPR